MALLLIATDTTIIAMVLITDMVIIPTTVKTMHNESSHLVARDVGAPDLSGHASLLFPRSGHPVRAGSAMVISWTMDQSPGVIQQAPSTTSGPAPFLYWHVQLVNTVDAPHKHAPLKNVYIPPGHSIHDTPMFVAVERNSWKVAPGNYTIDVQLRCDYSRDDFPPGDPCRHGDMQTCTVCAALEHSLPGMHNSAPLTIVAH
ncbi:hypothetical protein RI367_005874 [Sorochytrium milnesiophthora]